ncbi:MAG TPA: helix-turn-helix transcriptional regulator [Stackebrandtia sp.]|jgi:transcriptional regulator with XRE-family HTH domain|nr:helix-turn-helix transcriptional regulator [Stackebrandtia sp.]HZE38366.1 helix-turn-helix transcriptional regulator [Stackebrandtia sp.]
MVLLRRIIGETLRTRRREQRRTLRDVSGAANVSLGYLSEVERGQKEASSELLSSICEALDIPLSDVLGDVTSEVAREEHSVAKREAVALLRPVSRLEEHRKLTDLPVPQEHETTRPMRREPDRPMAPPASLAAARARRARRVSTQPAAPKASVAA